MQSLLQFIFGICVIGILPVVITREFQKGNTFFGKLPCDNNSIYFITLSNILILFLVYKNIDILLGTLLGSSLFQLLAVGGVNELILPIKGRKENNGQYLAFCMILLLFLSADYLLSKEIKNNMLNRIDGGLLLFLFVIYCYFLYRNREIEKKNWRGYITYFVSLEIIIAFGGYLLIQSIPKIGVALGISQYLTGLTIVSWCVNLSTMILSRKKIEEKNINYLEKAMKSTVFSITLLLGGIVLIHPLVISSYMIYDIILFAIITLLLPLIQKIDNRLAGSSMVTVYIAFIVYAFAR